MKRLNKVTALLLVFLLAFSSFGITALAEGTEPETMQANETPLTPEETADTILQRLRDFVDTIKRFIQAIKDFIYGILGIVKPIYIPVDSVSLSDEFLLMSVGDTVALTPIISPDDASKKQVAWASDDESVATVDANGNVLAVGTGFATITVTTVDGGKTASVQVLVGDIAVPADGSIQAAIDAASPGQVIAVAPGVYREQLSVYKAIVLLGPNFDIPGSADRGPEAVITYPDGADITNGALIDVSANNVFIKGFSCLNEEATAPVDAQELIFTGVNIEFTNNRVVSAGDKIALYFGDANAAETDRWGLVIAGNYIESGSRYAALVVENTGAIIETNEIYGGSVALQISPLANTVGGAVNDNVLQAADAAILHENAFNGSGEWSYDGNIIAPLATANAFRWPDGYFRGFAARSIGVSGTGADPAVSFAGNIIEVPEDYDEAVWSETIGFHFIADISDTAVFDFTGNTIAGVTFGAVRDAGLADLDAILADNTFPEGSMVTGNVIKVPTWADMADTSWFVSSNTSFTLTTGAQLAGLAALVNSGTNFNGKTVNLGADIDLMNLEWTPIGNASNWFRGIFNGNDYKISGLKITDNTLAAVGLFGYVRASSGDGAGIRNLEISGKIDIKDANVMSPNVGLVAGLVWGFVENCRTTDVKADNTIIYKSIFSQSGQHRPAVGGLVGYNANSGYPHNGITGSSFTGTILVETTVEYIPGVTPNSGPYLGGLVGMANRVNVSGSTVNADITGNAYRYMAMGGIIGYAMGEKMSFNDLTFTGDLNGHTNMVGESASTSCSLQMGGIVGAGEFAGDAGECGVVNATVSGSLTADIDGVGARVYTGGVVGYVYPYWRDPLLAKFEIVDCNVDLQHNVILDSEASVYTGGLTGLVYNDATVKSTIDFRNSTVAGEISVTNTVATTTEEAFVGGLLGYGYKYNSDSALNPQFFITNCTAVTPTVSLDYPTLGTGDNWGRNDWVVASIGNVYYESLEVAIAALQDGDTLTILTDEFILDKKILFKKNDITIQGQTDVNGNPITTIKGAGNSVEQFRIEGYNVTVRDLIFDNIADGGTARESQGVYFYYPNNVWQADRVNKLINCVSYNTYWAIFSGVKMSFEMEGCTFQKTDTTSSVFMDRPYEVTIIDSSFLGQEGYALHIDNGVVDGIFDAKDCIFTGGVVTAGASENNTGVGNAVYTFTDCGFYTSSGVNGGWYASYYSSGSKFENCSFDADFDGAGTGQYSYLGSYVYLDPDCTKEGSSLDLTFFYNVGENVISGVNVLLNSEDKIIGGMFASDPTANLADGYVANESSGIWIVSQD